MNTVNMRRRGNLFLIGSLVTFVFFFLMEGPKYHYTPDHNGRNFNIVCF